MLTKQFTFKFAEYDDGHNEKFATEFPVSSEIKASHEFESGITWVPILSAFVKFLESTGYCGVRERIHIKDNFGFHESGLHFETFSDEDKEYDFDEIKAGLDSNDDVSDDLARDDEYIDEIYKQTPNFHLDSNDEDAH